MAHVTLLSALNQTLNLNHKRAAQTEGNRETRQGNEKNQRRIAHSYFWGGVWVGGSKVEKSTSKREEEGRARG